MRFNCVSKAWNTLIRHDLYFLKSHLLFELLESSDVAVKESKKRWLEGFSPKQLANCHYFYDNDMMCICGLVCLHNVKDSQVYLLNVTTEEIKASGI